MQDGKTKLTGENVTERQHFPGYKSGGSTNEESAQSTKY